MTTVRGIVNSAMRKLRLIPPGGVADAGESADGLSALQAMYDGWCSSGMFGRLTDKIVSANYTAAENERVRKDAACTVTIPTTIADCETRVPRDLALIEVIYQGLAQRHLYDAATGQWVRLDGLTLDSEAPLSSRDEAGLASCLAEIWGEEFGAALGPAAKRAAIQFRMRMALTSTSQHRSNQAVYF